LHTRTCFDDAHSISVSEKSFGQFSTFLCGRVLGELIIGGKLNSLEDRTIRRLGFCTVPKPLVILRQRRPLPNSVPDAEQPEDLDQAIFRKLHELREVKHFWRLLRIVNNH
jgi:hypothetical protein